MNCSECGTVLDKEKGIPIQTGCHRFEMAYPCLSCGRLHLIDGDAVFDREGQNPVSVLFFIL
jgi:hypothetical protein